MMDDYYGTEHYGPIGPPEGNKSSATTEPELIDDERYARAVANQGKQVTALSMRCAELESERAALAAENARLRELLHRIIACESWLVEDLTMPDTYYCAVCDEQADDDGVVAHKDGCPVADARRALEGGASTPDSVRVKLRLRYVGELPPPELRDEDVLEDDAP